MEKTFKMISEKDQMEKRSGGYLRKIKWRRRSERYLRMIKWRKLVRKYQVVTFIHKVVISDNLIDELFNIFVHKGSI